MSAKLLLVVSLFVFWLGVSLLGYLLWPVAKLEYTYQVKRLVTPDSTSQSELEEIQPGIDQIVIPAIDAQAPLIWHVDHANQDTYEAALLDGVAHAVVSALPGEQGNSFLFAHSSTSFQPTRTVNTSFYLLPKLGEGDPIYIDRDGSRYRYIVTGKEIVNPDQVEYLTQFSPTPTLTLMTCYPLGTSLKRYLVFASLDTSQF